jgi:hypothetical protein
METRRKSVRRAAGWAVLLAAIPAGAARVPQCIVDPGLHRQWIVEPDRLHPERPPRLVEVAWSGPDAGSVASPHVARVAPAKRAPAAEPPVVRAGMRVVVWWRDQATELRLTGTALEAGRNGQTVRVRAGLHGAVVRGVVRGPALVELEPGER